MIHSIREVEELTLNAWPALRQVLYDGWVLRFADGFTRRANSISPLYPGRLDAQEKIEFCESVYRREKLTPMFKLTREAHPKDLEAILLRQGYQESERTSVATLDLLDAPGAAWRQDTKCCLQTWDHLTEPWLDAYTQFNNVNTEQRRTLSSILRSIVPPCRYVAVLEQGQIAAVIMGACQHSWVGIFDLVTAPAYRGRGLGRCAVESLLRWGLQQKARIAYLQVFLTNTVARRLYERIGFRDAYQYWYYVKP